MSSVRTGVVALAATAIPSLSSVVVAPAAWAVPVPGEATASVCPTLARA